MKISELLNNSNEDEISDLWGIFIEKSRLVIEAYNFLNGLEFKFLNPEYPKIVTLQTLTDYIMAKRVYDLACKEYKNQQDQSLKILENLLAGMKSSILVLDAWVNVDDYAIIYHSEKDSSSPNYLKKFSGRVTVKRLHVVNQEIEEAKHS